MDQILHNLTIDNNPSDAKKLAMGDGSSTDTNITLGNFYTLLMSKLGFFKISNYLSEIFGNTSAMSAVRANIDVPSIGEMTTADNLRAMKTNVIEKDSTTTYTPYLSTHPTNKKYVDHKIITETTLSNVNSNVDLFNVKSIQTRYSVQVSGTMRIKSDPTPDIIFSLPLTFDAPIIDTFFIGSDGNGSTSQTTVFKIAAGSRDVYVVTDEWSTQLLWFNLVFITQ